MPSQNHVTKIFQDLKSGVLGTKSSRIDKEIDISLHSIETYSSKTARNKYIDALRSLIKTTGHDGPEKLIKELQSNRIEMYDQFGRLQRYKEYDTIISKISYCNRALNVLTDNVISPDDITKRSILFLKQSEEADKKQHTDGVINRLKEIEKAIEFDKHIYGIIKKTLKKGDLFIEILYSPKAENAFTVLHEDAKRVTAGEPLTFSIQNTTNKKEKDEDKPTENINESISGKVIIEYTFGGVLSGINPQTVGFSAANTGTSRTSVPVDVEPISKDKHGVTVKTSDKEDESRFQSKADAEKLASQNKEVLLRDIFISIHDPKFVIRLETERFKTCLGFLVFPKIDPASLAMGALSIGTNAVDTLCYNIINQLEKTLQLDKSQDTISATPELKNVIFDYLRTVKNNDDLKVRYIPPEMMIHWRLNVDRFYPYGESIFENVAFDCKLLMALKVATTIKRLTSATDKRIVSVETGLPRDAKNLIELIKEGMRKRKISVDSFGSIDSIPSQIATFEDIYIPMRDGKKYVEFDNVQWGPNAQDDIEPLKFIRDNIVANLDVPPAFIGLEDNVSNRALLSVENIVFCRSIIALQKELSIPLRELFEKIYNLLYAKKAFEDMRDVRVTFREPKISPYEHEMEYVEQMQRLIEAYKALGIPDNYLKRKYLPDLNWDEIESYKAENTMKTELGEEAPESGGMGMGGMGGFGAVPPISPISGGLPGTY